MGRMRKWVTRVKRCEFAFSCELLCSKLTSGFLIVLPDRRRCAVDDKVAEEGCSTRSTGLWTALATRRFIVSAGNQEVDVSVATVETRGAADTTWVDEVVGVWVEWACRAIWARR